MKIKKSMRRLASGVLSTTILLSALAVPAMAANVSDFTDVKTDDWFYNYVSYAAEKGMVNGTSTTTFSPSETMSRGMFITVLGRAFTDQSATGSKFTDVSSSEYWYPYVYWGVDKGVTNGFSDTTFAPNNDITRQQMATMVGRAIEKLGLTVEKTKSDSYNYSDSDKIADYAKDAIQLCWETGLMVGDTGGTFRPEASVTRAEGTTVLARLMTAVEKANTGSDSDTDTPSTDPTPDTPSETPTVDENGYIPGYVDHFANNPFYEGYEIPVAKQEKAVKLQNNPAFKDKYSYISWDPVDQKMVFGEKGSAFSSYTPTAPAPEYNPTNNTLTATIITGLDTCEVRTFDCNKPADWYEYDNDPWSDFNALLKEYGWDTNTSHPGDGWHYYYPTGTDKYWQGYGTEKWHRKNESYAEVLTAVIEAHNKAKIDSLVYFDSDQILLKGDVNRDMNSENYFAIELNLYYKNK